MIDKFDKYFICFYNKNQNSLLNQLCDKYGSDKGEISNFGHPYPWPSHTYADYIEKTFYHCRNNILNVFECGLGTNYVDAPSNMSATGIPGASLRVWKDYFPNANIVGIDVDQRILFEEERISTFHCDQTNPKMICDVFNEIKVQKFDLMIDDGLHIFNAGICLFENAFHKLRQGGIYIIEDVNSNDLMLYQKYFAEKREFNSEIISLFSNDEKKPFDNNLIVIRNMPE